jgi:aspartate/methionine/tyrosine aminotransferase
LDKFFSDNGEVVGWVRPQGGMTTLGWLQSGEDARPFCEALAKKGVLLAPGDCFEMPSYFRLGFGASGERFPQALARLSEFVQNIHHARASRAG